MKTISLSRDINLLRREKIQDRNKPINPLFNAWAEVDLSTIRYNIALLKEQTGIGCEVLAVIKADAYGHGLREVSRVVLDCGVNWLGVTSITEAMELRRLHPRARILILSAGLYAHSKLIIKHRLTPILCSRQMAVLLNDAAAEAGKKIKVHIKIDTGMGRLGAWYQNALEFIKYVAELPHLELEGICSHFAKISSCALDAQFTEEQLAAFQNVVNAAAETGISFSYKHIGNSGALLTFPKAHLDMVRIGISTYGLFPSSELECQLPLKPALSLKSRVAFLKTVDSGRTISYGCTYVVQNKTKIATIPIGYNNGYCRSFSGKGQVIIKGKRAPVVGIVTMDQIMVDVGHIPDVAVGNEVVLIGEQMGERITASEVAKWAGTISYEILCKLNVPRVYFE